MSLPQLIDTHAHLDDRRFADDRQEVVERALAAGISHIVTVGTDPATSRQSVEIARSFPTVYAAVGIHPHDALQATDEAMDRLRELIRPGNKVVAVGETGLDYYRDRSPREAQQRAFRRHIALAREVGLPLIVHDREAHADVLRILREEGARETGGVLHCFSGDVHMARECLALGFHISFPGTITYPTNEAAREVVRAVPTEQMLIETDCPYLAPQPQRGKRNEPAFVRHTAQMVAQVKGLSLEDVARVTTLNAYQLFGIGEVDLTAKIAYRIRSSLYLNITNRCTNSCTFCAKFRDFTVKGHHLRLDREPTAEEVKKAVGRPEEYAEVVFCGYGEPLIRLDLIKEMAGWLKQKGVRVRINTDGQANLVHGRDILPELAGLIDAVSVSLNAPDADTYERLCRSRFGAEGYQAVLEFLRQAPRHIPSVTATAVALPGVDMGACRRVAAELGVEFREREYNEVG